MKNGNNDVKSKSLIAIAVVVLGGSLLFLTTATTFPNVAIFATPFFAPEGDGTTTTDNTTTTTPPEEEETTIIEETTTEEEAATTPPETMNDTTTTTNQTRSNTSQGTAEGNITTFNPQSKMPTNVEGCNALASVVEGKALPDHDLCDVVVYRQAPPIVRSDGIVLNNFSGLGHYIEFVPAIVNETGTFAASTLNTEGQQESSEGEMTTMMRPEFTNDNPAVSFGEFAVLDEEVIPVREVMQKYNWTETALHHHMLDENPKVLFLHWSVTGTPDELIQQGREIIEVTSTYNQTTTSETGISTPSSAGP